MLPPIVKKVGGGADIIPQSERIQVTAARAKKQEDKQHGNTTTRVFTGRRIQRESVYDIYLNGLEIENNACTD